MIRSRRTSRCSGYSLIELTAAMFVFATALLGTVQMYNVIAGKLFHVRESEIAAGAVNAEIETLRALPFSQLADRENASFVSQPRGIENLVNFTTRLTIRPYQDPKLNLKEVTATVVWTGEHGRQIEKSAMTLIADKEAGT